MEAGMRYSQRTETLKAEGAYQVLSRAQQLEASGREIIHLEIGQPDFPTLPNICQAGISAIENGLTRYTSPAGMPELRAAIATAAGQQRGLSFSPEQVVVSPGAKPNLFFPTLAVVEPGDEVIYPDPGFPTYEAMIAVAGGVPVPVPLSEEANFSFDMDAFERLAGPKTRLIILNSPSNPTGGIIPLSDLERIAAAAVRLDSWVLSDEIYAQLVFDGQTAPTLYSLPGMEERTIIMDGFSKTYSMTGWRLGYGIMPAPLARRVELLLTHSIGSTAHFTQVAGIEALSGPQDRVEEMRLAYQERRDVLVDGLNRIPGVTCRTPQGAFYAFPNVKSFGVSSADLANRLLDQGGVAVLPGSAFGQSGEGYLRLSFAASKETLLAGLERIEAVLRHMD
jgi:aspartate aminotransferase